MRIEKTIGGEKFIFDKATLRLREMYLELSDLTNDLIEITDQYSTDIKSIDIAKRDGESDDEAEARATVNLAKMKEISLGFNEKKATATEDIGELREKMLEYLLKRNGYGFDKDLWWNNADINDINEIVTGVFK